MVGRCRFGVYGFARSIAGIAAALSAGAVAHAQLREQQTLVVYDSRIADSKAVAEFYAGSAKVPAGSGGQTGVHPNVQVLDLATRLNATGGPAGVFPPQGDIDYTTFKSQLRDPLRVYLAQANLAGKVRCIVLTKGIPHRVQNISNTAPLATNIGDNPAGINNALNAGVSGNFTYCSTDSELSLLQQSLDTGEAGGQGDSHADGMIVNPFWRATTTVNGYSTRYIQSTKTWLFPGAPYNGFYWVNQANLATTTALSPGDIYLVCRLDGNSVADVTAAINRAQNVVYNTSTATFILDSDGSNLDGTGDPAAIDAGPDYSLARTTLVNDGRFAAGNVRYDVQGNFTGFMVGPNGDYSAATNGPPIVVPNPLVLIASFGSNHSGVNGNGTSAGTTYATTFNYAPGAVFNTLESYNGRSLGGIGGNPFVPQMQAADAIGAGVTFAIGHVWEPFGLTVADNDQLARNFFLGNMTWGEAAYAATPVLSWQHVFLGDPLARPRRDSDDVNADGRVNIDDLYRWTQAPTDINRSGAADDADLQLLEKSVRAFELASMKGDQR